MNLRVLIYLLGEMSNKTHHRRVTLHQLEMLWEYLNSHREIATTFNRSLEAKQYSKRQWSEIAKMLNAQGVDGAIKDGKEWSKYWIDYKAKLKKRISAIRISQNGTGGGPSTAASLTEIELKFLQILGEDFGQGLPGVQVNPFPTENPPTNYTEQIPISVEVSVEPCETLLSPSTQTTAHPVTSPPPVSPPPISPAPISPPPISPQSDFPAAPQRSRSSRTPRVRRRDPPISLEYARRSLVESAQIRAEATVRGSNALEAILETLQRIERLIGN